jgi:hypothetical protein
VGEFEMRGERYGLWLLVSAILGLLFAAITEMEDGKVKSARQYFAAPQWVERM